MRGSKSSEFKPGQDLCVVVLNKTLSSPHASLSTQEYKWVPANSQRILDKMLRVTYDFRASHK